jgi:hypothetical protein
VVPFAFVLWLRVLQQQQQWCQDNKNNGAGTTKTTMALEPQ